MRRVRPDVCKAILLTSIFWLIVYAFILFYYLDRSLLPADRRSDFRTAKFGRSDSKSGDDAFRPTTSDALERLLGDLVFDTSGPGANGDGVTIDKDREEKMREMFKLNQFNLMASNLISINRTLLDYRSEKCKSVGGELKNTKLEPVSIVIVFHNEAFSTLLRTLHSVVNRSPQHLIKEIILIDDLSDRDFLKEPLGLYIKRFPVPVHLVHLEERSGLIRARLTGSSMAKGEILLFLDAHVEVSEGWLEPLIARVTADRTVVVAPIIDVISDETFEYVTASDTTWGGFNWHLNFRWYPVPDREMKRRNWDRSLPIQTPTIAGGLFAIDRKFFYDVGAYDEGMKVWGGENLEISFRVWTCGGSLEIHPCSRVGHVFRKQTPYTFPGGTATVIHHNAARTAEVWMDDYKHFFYAMVPAARSVDFGNVTARRQLRTDLKCKSFKWYLENIYLESPIPARYHSIGQILNQQSRTCLDTMGLKSGQPVGLSACHGIGGNQAWSLTASGEIRSDELCVAGRGHGGNGLDEVFLEKCSEKIVNHHAFKYLLSTKNLVHQETGNCLVANGDNLALSPCAKNQPDAIWKVENYHELFPSAGSF